MNNFSFAICIHSGIPVSISRNYHTVPQTNFQFTSNIYFISDASEPNSGFWSEINNKSLQFRKLFFKLLLISLNQSTGVFEFKHDRIFETCQADTTAPFRKIAYSFCGNGCLLHPSALRRQHTDWLVLAECSKTKLYFLNLMFIEFFYVWDSRMK